MENKNIFDRIRDRTSDATKKYVAKRMDIVLKIHNLLNKHGKTYDDLLRATCLSKQECCDMYSLSFDFNLRTIAEIEDFFGEEILTIVK